MKSAKQNKIYDSHRIIKKENCKLLLLLFITAPFFAQAKENIGTLHKQQNQATLNAQKTASACSQSGSQVDLDVNNVRTKILGGGDMWWDLKNVKYEIPPSQPLWEIIE